jgi:predicted nucleic-acid-binding protein
MPLAADTNVLGRALTDDGSEQSRQAVECFRNNEIFVSDTVLLETEWLFRSRLGLSRQEINALFSFLISSPNVIFDDRPSITESVLAHRNGLDFADAMHLFAARDCEAMVTFDRDFIRRSKKISGVIAVRKP